MGRSRPKPRLSQGQFLVVRFARIPLRFSRPPLQESTFASQRTSCHKSEGWPLRPRSIPSLKPLHARTPKTPGVPSPPPPFLVKRGGRGEGGFEKSEADRKKGGGGHERRAKEEVLRVPDEDQEKAIELVLQGKLSWSREGLMAQTTSFQVKSFCFLGNYEKSILQEERPGLSPMKSRTWRIRPSWIPRTT